MCFVCQLTFKIQSAESEIKCTSCQLIDANKLMTCNQISIFWSSNSLFFKLNWCSLESHKSLSNPQKHKMVNDNTDRVHNYGVNSCIFFSFETCIDLVTHPVNLSRREGKNPQFIQTSGGYFLTSWKRLYRGVLWMNWKISTYRCNLSHFWILEI